MTKRTLCLLLSILLSGAPGVSAALRQGPAAKPVREAGGLPGAAALPALPPAFTAPVQRLEAGDGAALRALAGDPSAAALLVRSVAARPELLAEPAMRAQAELALGPAGLARLEQAVASAAERSVSDGETAAALAELRRSTVVSDPARAALERVLKEAGAWLRPAPAEIAAAGSEASPAARTSLAKPTRRAGVLRRAAVAAALAAALWTTAPVSLAQEAARPPVSPPAAGLLLEQAPEQARAQAREVLQVRDINEAIAKFDPARTRIVVIGNPGVPAATLEQIAKSLEGTSWFVVLVGDASGNVFVDAQRRRHHDVEAIDRGTGEAIYNNGGMSRFVHPQTGEQSSVLLTIVMEQRELMLRGSPAMRNRGIDAQNGQSGRSFKGDLDQWSVNNLRAGRNVQAAVLETQRNIDALLTQAIAAEKATGEAAVASAKSALAEYQKARAEFAQKHPAAAGSVGRYETKELSEAIAAGERELAAKRPAQAGALVRAALAGARAATAAMSGFEQSLAAAQAQLAQAAQSVDAAEKAAAAFRKEHKDAAGDLARPDAAGWRQALSSAKSSADTNPQKAAADAGAVQQKAKAVVDGLAQAAGAAQKISEAQALEKSLSQRERAGSASDALVSARQSLRESEQSFEDGSSLWSAKLDAAKGSLADAERRIAKADANAKRDAFLFWLLLSLATLATAGAAFWLNRRARLARAKAEQALVQWDRALEAKLDTIIDTLDQKMDAYVGTVSGPKSRGWVGQTAALTAEIRSGAGVSKLLLAKARQVHDQATALVRPQAWTSARWYLNLVWPSNYRKAEAKLDNEPIEFKPADGLDSVFGKTNGWQDDLYGDVSHYQPFKMTFTELMAEFNSRSRSATGSLERLEHAITQSGAILRAVDDSIAATAAKQAALARADGLFGAAALFESSLPAASALSAQARTTAVKDPISGVYGAGAEAQRIVADAEALVAALSAAGSGALKRVAESAKSILQSEVGTEWIDAEKRALSAEADRLAAAAATATATISGKIESLSGKLEALAEKAADADKGAKMLAEKRAEIKKTAASVAAARETIGRALELPAERMLTEENANPSEFLAKATASADLVDELIGKGKLDEAHKAYDALLRGLTGAQQIVQASLESLRTHAAVEQQRRAETERLKGLVPERQGVLASIEREFAASTLKLNSGDASHPNANGTVKDNIDEAEVSIAASAEKRKSALSAFKQGRLIEADSFLDAALAHQEIAQHRLDEISEKRARLDRTVAANARTQAALGARVAKYETDYADDRRSMQGTLKAFESAKTQLKAASRLVEADQGDPFLAEAALASVGAALDQVSVSARNDFDMHAEVERSAKAARAQLDEATRQAQAARGDNIGDSPAIQRAYGELGQLERAYTKLLESMKAVHGDWPAVDREADLLTSQAAQIAANLKGELAAAARAAQEISNAASRVREATNWTGSFGVYIPGSPGSGSLDSARAALSRGDYSAAISHAESARRAAASAIEQAEDEVRRRRRAEEERQRREEEERRRRQREEEERRSRSSYSGGGGGSSNSGSSWGGGSSSGNSRSGW